MSSTPSSRPTAPTSRAGCRGPRGRLDGTREFIASTIGQDLDRGGRQVALIVAGKIAGVLGYHAPDRENHSVCLGYWLASDQQGRGLMTTAVRTLVGHAFDEWELNRVEIRVAPTTSAAGRSPSGSVSARRACCARRSASATSTATSILYARLASEWRLCHP